MLVSAVQQSESVIRIHISPLFYISVPFRSPQSIDWSSLCYTVGSHTEWSKSERKKQISYNITYMWNLEKWYRWTYLQSKNRVTDVENKLTVPKGGLRAGMNWEVGIGIYTPLQITAGSQQASLPFLRTPQTLWVSPLFSPDFAQALSCLSLYFFLAFPCSQIEVPFFIFTWHYWFSCNL